MKPLRTLSRRYKSGVSVGIGRTRSECLYSWATSKDVKVNGLMAFPTSWKLKLLIIKARQWRESPREWVSSSTKADFRNLDYRSMNERENITARTRTERAVTTGWSCSLGIPIFY